MVTCENVQWLQDDQVVELSARRCQQVIEDPPHGHDGRTTVDALTKDLLLVNLAPWLCMLLKQGDPMTGLSQVIGGNESANPPANDSNPLGPNETSHTGVPSTDPEPAAIENG
jgi:hypothetical protein